MTHSSIQGTRNTTDRKVECTCGPYERRNGYNPKCYAPDCPQGIQNLVAEEQETAEYETYLNGLYVSDQR